ncbi:phosphoribosylglycinamide formyltransferase [candidate division KSB1 bacterium]
MNNKPLRLAVFASGTGTNFQTIYRNILDGNLNAGIAGLITNNPEAGALVFAEANNIPVEIINKKRFPEDGAVTEEILKTLQGWQPDLIVLAGYMKMLARKVVDAYPKRIVNIHPALLPSFGGKGMYGIHVHEAVIEHGVRFTGVTVHIVDYNYDTGPIILQKIVPVQMDDTPATLQKRVLQEEYKIYTEAIRLFAENRISFSGRRVIIQDYHAENQDSAH